MAESVRIVDDNGDPVLSQITKQHCWLVIGTQVFAYPVPREGQQHTPPLQNVYVDEALSHAISFNLFTLARTGQILSLECLGVGQDAAVSKIT